MTEKECSKCLKILPLSLFDTEKSGYVRNSCHQCRLVQIKQARLKKAGGNKVTTDSKECCRCKKAKLSSEFSKRSIAKDGLAKECKECYSTHRHKKNSTSAPESIDKTLICCKCLVSKPNNSFRTSAKSKTGYFKTCNDCWKPIEWNAEKQKASEKKYVNNNPEKIRAKWKKAGNNLNRKVRDRLNHRIADAFKSIASRKTNKTVEYTGCSIDYLKKWFEFQFDDKIGWFNYGDWHIDHVKPCSSFDLSNMDEQLICFNWRNLRPCLKEDNMKKGDKILEHLIEQQKEKVSEFLKVNPLPTLPGDRVGGAE